MVPPMPCARRRSLLSLLGLLALYPAALPALGAAPLTVVTEEFPPFNYTRDGKLAGYAVEIVQALLAQAGVDYSMASYPWERAYRMAQLKPNVLIFSIVRTPRREALFQWIAPVARRKVYLYKLAKRHDVQLQSLNDLRRYRVAVNRSDVAQTQLQALGLELGRQIDLSSQDVTNIRKLAIGRADFIVATEFSIVALCAGAGVPFELLERTLMLPGDSDYYIAASLGTPPATVERLRAAFRKLQHAPALRRIDEKYQGVAR